MLFTKVENLHIWFRLKLFIVCSLTGGMMSCASNMTEDGSHVSKTESLPRLSQPKPVPESDYIHCSVSYPREITRKKQEHRTVETDIHSNQTMEALLDDLTIRYTYYNRGIELSSFHINASTDGQSSFGALYQFADSLPDNQFNGQGFTGLLFIPDKKLNVPYQLVCRSEVSDE